jgi:nucleoside-diphosphate-sugar epimerase
MADADHPRCERRHRSRAALSVTHATVTERLKKGKTPQWIANPKAIHTFTYTRDAGRTLALVGNTPSAYGQVWHALTSKEPITGEQYVGLACEIARRPYALQVAPRWMLRLMGIFVTVVRESIEMLDQFEYDYRFDSSKVERAFGLTQQHTEKVSQRRWKVNGIVNEGDA